MAHSVVIADDTEVMRAMIRLALEDAHCEIAAEASSGNDALAAYRIHRPDCLVLDVQLGDMTGLDVAREIKKEYPDLRFVICTSQGQEDLIKEAVTMGAADFVLKPFQPDRIVQAVRTAVGA